MDALHGRFLASETQLRQKNYRHSLALASGTLWSTVQCFRCVSRYVILTKINGGRRLWLAMLMKTRQSKVLKIPSIIQAPKWLIRRMETLQRMPPPTLKEVAAHLKAS